MNTDGIAGHAVQLGRLSAMLKGGKVPHALLFTGVRGTGKMIIARRFTAALHCGNSPAPCMKCAECVRFFGMAHPDHVELVPNEKGVIPIGTEEKREKGTVRGLISRLSVKAIGGKATAIIDGVDSMTEEGQNAILKLIEEPSGNTFIVMIASTRVRMLPTIISRCLEMRFPELQDVEIRAILESRGVAGKNLDYSVRASGGSVESALALAEAAAWEDIGLLRDGMLSAVAGKAFLLDTADLEKKLGKERLLDCMINVFRDILHLSISNNRNCGETGADYCEKDILMIISILCAVREGLSRNLNIRNALKGLLYSLRSAGNFENEAFGENVLRM
jgi:DNA polymerase-3 subunit delta'